MFVVFLECTTLFYVAFAVAVLSIPVCLGTPYSVAGVSLENEGSTGYSSGLESHLIEPIVNNLRYNTVQSARDANHK